MAELVAAFAASHTPLLYTRAGEPSPEVQEDTFSAFRRMGQVIRERGAEALVVFGNDHLHALFMDRHPALAIGIRSRFKRVASEPYLPQFEGGYPGNERLGFHLARSLLAGHFDPALCQDIDLDHSVIIPMHLMGDPDIPLVPILQNMVAPPPPISYQRGRRRKSTPVETVRTKSATGSPRRRQPATPPPSFGPINRTLLVRRGDRAGVADRSRHFLSISEEIQ